MPSTHWGAEGNQCFFVDDLQVNIDAALATGIEAHLYVPDTYCAVRQAASGFFGWEWE